MFYFSSIIAEDVCLAVKDTRGHRIETTVTFMVENGPRAPLLQVWPVIMKFKYAFLGSLATLKSKECIVCLYF